MILVGIVATALATWSLVEVLTRGSLFRWVRAYFEAYDNWIGDLARCRFCLSYWAGAVTTLVWELSCSWNPLQWIGDIPVLILVWLANVRLANLLSDLTHNISRTPREDQTELGDDADEVMDPADLAVPSPGSDMATADADGVHAEVSDADGSDHAAAEHDDGDARQDN
jgi:hypothetical protein